MKRNCVPALVCLAILGTFAGCASMPKVSRVDAGTQLDLSGRWNDTDVRHVCQSLLDQCFGAPRIDQEIQKYRQEHSGTLPSVVVGTFRNTSSEHIDTGIISQTMQTVIINSGKLDFVAGGDNREELRAERQDQNTGNVSEDTAAALGHETGAKFILQGSVKSIVDAAGNKSVRSYFVTAELTDVETNRIIWSGQNSDIKKVTEQPKYKL
jgi:uncharacterized protein (TIGR02722 family)